MEVYKTILLVGSNVAFLLPAWAAFKDNMIYEGIRFTLMGFVSGFYHIIDCYPKMKNLLGLSLSVWSKMDFFMAFGLITATTMMVLWNTGRSATGCQRVRNFQIKHPIQLIIDAVTLALVLRDIETPLFVFILALISICILNVVMFIYPEELNLDWSDLIVGIFLTIIGVLCYFLCNSSKCYFWAHSMWHILIACAIFMMVETRNLNWSCITCQYR